MASNANSYPTHRCYAVKTSLLFAVVVAEPVCRITVAPQRHKKTKKEKRNTGNAAEQHVFPHYRELGSAQSVCSITQLMKVALSAELRELEQKVIYLHTIRRLNVR